MVKIKIICEGDDDKNIIISLINNLIKNTKIDKKYSKNIASYIQHMGPKSVLLDYDHQKYDIIKKEIKVDKYEKLFFIFDCDFIADDEKCGGMELSKKCYDDLIKKFKLPTTFYVDYFIFDTNLEHFLLNTIKENKCYKDFNNLVECLELKKLQPNKKPIANLYRELYPKPSYDFNHKNFDTLKKQLIELFAR